MTRKRVVVAVAVALYALFGVLALSGAFDIDLFVGSPHQIMNAHLRFPTSMRESASSKSGTTRGQERSSRFSAHRCVGGGSVRDRMASEGDQFRSCELLNVSFQNDEFIYYSAPNATERVSFVERFGGNTFAEPVFEVPP